MCTYQYHKRLASTTKTAEYSTHIVPNAYWILFLWQPDHKAGQWNFCLLNMSTVIGKAVNKNLSFMPYRR